jgi:hypothetical protein
LSKRLVSRVPEAADAVDLVTQTYEWERYGSVHPPRDRVRALQAAIARLSAADAERRTV